MSLKVLFEILTRLKLQKLLVVYFLLHPVHYLYEKQNFITDCCLHEIVLKHGALRNVE